MNELTSIEQRFRDINPVPDPSDPPMGTETAATTRINAEDMTVTMPMGTTQRTKTGPRRVVLIATSAAAIVVLLGAGLLAMLTTARDSREVADNAQTGVFATSIDDVAGRWRASEYPWFIELAQAGSHWYGVDEARLEENMTGRPDGTYRFDGNLAHIESSDCKIRDIVEPGIYRIRLLTPNLIQFEPVEENCEFRRTLFAVDSSTFEPVTWSRVED
ncbi:MAG: hypothetical protein ACR2NL_13045 [Acidimicrobiia bacterium]